MTSETAGWFISVQPDVMHGERCFAGTRVRAKALFDLLARGRSLDYFLDAFPTVNCEQAVAALEAGHQHLIERATRPAA